MSLTQCLWQFVDVGPPDDAERTYAGVFHCDDITVGFVNTTPAYFDGVVFCAASFVRNVADEKRAAFFAKAASRTPLHVDADSLSFLQCTSVIEALQHAKTLDCAVFLESFSNQWSEVGKVFELDEVGVRLCWVSPDGDIGTADAAIPFEEIESVTINGSYERFMVNAVED